MVKKKMEVIDWIAIVLLIIGGLNWGLVGLANINLVTSIFSTMPTLVTIVYSAVGASALWSIYSLIRK